MMRQASQRRARDGNDEVLFGIRAIERGIEVEGVWISRGNTPEPPSTRDTSISSASEHLPPRDISIVLEGTASASPPERVRSKSLTRTSKCERTTAAMSTTDAVSNYPSSRDPSPTAPASRATKQHPPSSFAKYQANPALVRSSVSSSRLEDIGAMHRSSESYPSTADVNDFIGSGRSIEARSISAAVLDPLHGHGRPRQQSIDLDLMHSHRMSQAAEIGQLTPRTRRPGLSGDWANAVHGAGPDTSEYFESQRSKSQPPPTTNGHLPATTAPPAAGMPAPAWIDSLPASARRSSLPDVTPFAKFCQTAPTLPTVRRTASAESNESAMQAVGDSLSNYMSSTSTSVAKPAQSSTSASPSFESSQQARSAGEQYTQESDSHRRRSSFDSRESAVLRGHGTGFEILKHGTFSTPTGPPVEKSRSKPPVSLHHSIRSRSRSSSNGSRRKLQKKRRPSNDLQTSTGPGAAQDSK